MPQPDEVTIYLVLNDHGKHGIAYYGETDPAKADRETIFRNLLTGQYGKAPRCRLQYPRGLVLRCVRGHRAALVQPTRVHSSRSVWRDPTRAQRGANAARAIGFLAAAPCHAASLPPTYACPELDVPSRSKIGNPVRVHTVGRFAGRKSNVNEPWPLSAKAATVADMFYCR
jgi:hypothetical protein